MLFFTGQSPEGHPDVVGQSDYGHPGLSGAGHRAAKHGAAEEEAVRPNQGSHLPNHDQKYPGTFDLSAYCYFCSLI